MKYIEVPIEVSKKEDVEVNESIGIEPEWEPATASISTDSISYFFNNSDATTTVYFSNGLCMEVKLSYEDFRLLVKS